MKKIFRVTAKSKWADDRIKERGAVVQLAAETEDQYQFVSVDEKETDLPNFEHWSYRVYKYEIELEPLHEVTQEAGEQTSSGN